MAITPEKEQELISAGLTKEQIARFSAGEAGQTLAPTGQPPRPKQPRQPRAIRNLHHPLSWAVMQGHDLPAMLGTPGGFLPGPLGRELSFLGGAVGEGIEQNVMGQPPNVQAMGHEGAVQGVATMGGQMLGGMSRVLARPFMQVALRPKLRMGRMAPNVVDDALKQGATVSGKAVGGGSKGAAQVMGERGAVTQKGLDNAGRVFSGPSGPGRVNRFGMSQVLPNAREVVSSQAGEVGDQRVAARQIIDTIKRNHPNKKTPAELKAFKQQMWKEADAIIESKFSGSKVHITRDDPRAPLEARIKYQAGKKAQALLEGLPDADTMLPGGIGDAERATQKAINVHRAVEESEAVARSGVPWWIPATVGRGTLAGIGGAAGYATGDTPGQSWQNAAIGAGTGAALSHPAVASRLAWLLYQQGGLPALLRQTPRAGMALFSGGNMPPDTLDTNRP